MASGDGDESEEAKAQRVTDLVLELSLVTSHPVAVGGRDFIRASAAANSIAARTSSMGKKELRSFEWTVDPVVSLLIVDLDSPIASKAAFVLRTLMESRVCMSRLLEGDGLSKISKVLDILLSKKTADLRHHCDVRVMVEHLTVCYREIARFYPWNIVNVGGLRHCVVLLKYGDVAIQTISATTLASLSNDLEICKQMFSYGAIKPLLNISDGAITNDACMLAGLGCVTQLCRIPEIAVRVVQQGAVPLLEKGLHKFSGHNNQAIREKALYALGYLTKLPPIKAALCTDWMFHGLKHEFTTGTIGAKTSILQLLMNLHGVYPQERDIVNFIRDDLIRLLQVGPWNTRNYAIKVFCVLCSTNEDREYMTEKGIIELILDVIHAKDKELQEAPLVAFLHLAVHPKIPFQLLTKGVAKTTATLLQAQDAVIRELAVILLKSLSLFNQAEVRRVLPEEKQYVLQKDLYNPQLFGEEYGGLIQEYLQEIIENRRAHDYLIAQLPEDLIEELKIPMEDLKLFQNLFMELDAECIGVLGEDEVKMLVVLKGEVMDKDEVKELINQYDRDLKGSLNFTEFVIMMRSWDTKFGTGLTKLYNEKVKRGAIGKATRIFKQWWNKDKYEAAQVQLAKDRRGNSKVENRALELQFLPTESMLERRRKETWLRENGLSFSTTYFSPPPDEESVSNFSLPKISSKGSGSASRGGASLSTISRLS